MGLFLGSALLNGADGSGSRDYLSSWSLRFCARTTRCLLDRRETREPPTDSRRLSLRRL